jgi:hypothetical protein
MLSGLGNNTVKMLELKELIVTHLKRRLLHLHGSTVKQGTKGSDVIKECHCYKMGMAPRKGSTFFPSFPALRPIFKISPNG